MNDQTIVIRKNRCTERYPCRNARALLQTLGKALPVRGTVVKRREVFLVGRTRIHLDQVQSLGAFVELEVVLSDGEPAEHGKHVARDLFRKLDIPETGLLAQAYIDLLEASAHVLPSAKQKP